MAPFKLAGVFLIKFLTQLNCREIFCYLFSISFFFLGGEIFCCDFHVRFFSFLFFSFLFGNDLIWFRVIRRDDSCDWGYYYIIMVAVWTKQFHFTGRIQVLFFFKNKFNIEIWGIFFLN